MSTFHPAASLLANFNNTLSTISTTGTILTISTTRLFCHVHVLRAGVWSIFVFIIKHILGNKGIFRCSFGNKRMHLLTRVYGIRVVSTVQPCS